MLKVLAGLSRRSLYNSRFHDSAGSCICPGRLRLIIIYYLNKGFREESVGPSHLYGDQGLSPPPPLGIMFDVKFFFSRWELYILASSSNSDCYL